MEFYDFRFDLIDLVMILMILLWARLICHSFFLFDWKRRCDESIGKEHGVTFEYTLDGVLRSSNRNVTSAATHRTIMKTSSKRIGLNLQRSRDFLMKRALHGERRSQ